DLAWSAPRMRTGWVWGAPMALLCLCAASPARAGSGGDSPIVLVSNRLARSTTELARQSMDECEAGRHATDRALRKAHFERGQSLAERAVAENDGSAQAHFAVFCNMGELMRLDGESITSVFA